MRPDPQPSRGTPARRKLSEARRFLNRALVAAEYRLRRTYLFGRPYVLFVDTLNSCNLRCPLCPTGTGMKGRKRGKMTREVFQRVLDQLGPCAVEMVLHNWGEPLLHPDIFHFVREAEAAGIRTLLSSNMNLFDADTASAMIRSGLHRLIISLDGISAESYESYRIGGDFEAVKRNTLLLGEWKRKLGSVLPHTTLQFLVFKHNEHEVPEVGRLAAELGVDGVEVMSAYLGGKGQTPYTGHPGTRALAEKWLSRDPRYRAEFDYFRSDGALSPQSCYFLWRTVAVNWDGSITPCCCVYEESTNFGNLMEEPFAAIWNNPKYRSARALFGRRAAAGQIATICSACKTFRQSPRPGEESARQLE